MLTWTKPVDIKQERCLLKLFLTRFLYPQCLCSVVPFWIFICSCSSCLYVNVYSYWIFQHQTVLFKHCGNITSNKCESIQCTFWLKAELETGEPTCVRGSRVRVRDTYNLQFMINLHVLTDSKPQFVIPGSTYEIATVLLLSSLTPLPSLSHKHTVTWHKNKCSAELWVVVHV